MTKETLQMIDEAMAELNLNYEFMQYSSEIQYPYFVGEYSEIEPLSENGECESTFTINGFSRTTWLSLEDAKEAIENYFSSTGRATIHPSGIGVVVFFDSALPIPTGDAELKRIQIDLTVKEWKVN